MHCSLSNLPGKQVLCKIYSFSDMHVSPTQKESFASFCRFSCRSVALILFYGLWRLRMRRPSDDFMQEEAQGQQVAQASRTYTNHFSVNSKVSNKSIVLIVFLFLDLYHIVYCAGRSLTVKRNGSLKTIIHVSQPCRKMKQDLKGKGEKKVIFG